MRIALTLLFALVFNTVFAANLSLSGIVTNRLSDIVKFNYYTYDKNWLQHESHEVEVELDKKGSFSVNLPLANDYTRIRITNGGESAEIYASPGDKMKMTVDCERFDETIVFKGSGADIANLMAKYTLKYGLVSSYYKDVRAAQEKEAEEFLTEIEKLTQERINFLIQNSPGLPQSFVTFWDKDFEYRKYNAMLSYPRMNEVLEKRTYKVTPDPKNFYVVKKVPAKFDDKYLHISSYRNYSEDYYDAMLYVEPGNGDDDLYFREDKMLELAHKHMPKGTEEYVYAHYIETRIKHHPF